MLGQMATAQQRSKTYLNIKEGAIVKRTPQGEERYSFVEGVFENLSQKERTFRGETVLYWYIDLRDKETGELYSLGFPYGSNTFKSIILQLASIDGLRTIRNASTVRIEPYSKNGYDKVQVWGEDGVKFDWATKQLPPVEQTTIAGRSVKDDTKRMAFICSLANNVRAALTK